ncbi:hypothetical protein [Kaistia defluvii]|uniref:Uncharacterized protein n=1 Tax=Kaistia defluvii TaxID=410841 RepID=A0ABV2R4F3_9HYPH
MTDSSAHISGCLSERQVGTKLNNVKFFRGDASLIRAEDFRAENAKIDAQKRDNSATKSAEGPRVSKEKINFRDLVA